VDSDPDEQHGTVVPSVDLAELARLHEDDDDRGRVLLRIVQHAVSLVPGCTAAGLTVSGRGDALDVEVTGEDVARCHAVQFAPGGSGPAEEVMRYGEPRRADDLPAEERWPDFAATAAEAGFVSCLALPVGFDSSAASALNLYSDRPHAFRGTTYDLALLFAAQGRVALANADLYGQARRLVEHLHRSLTTRSVIERAKGLLMGRHQLSSEDAFALLRRRSQTEHRKVRDVAAALLDEADPGGGGDHVPWAPVRAPSGP
jgi:transcriptional regulator with GAF, ATPase, and Fis domain